MSNIQSHIDFLAGQILRDPNTRLPDTVREMLLTLPSSWNRNTLDESPTEDYKSDEKGKMIALFSFLARSLELEQSWFTLAAVQETTTSVAEPDNTQKRFRIKMKNSMSKAFSWMRRESSSVLDTTPLAVQITPLDEILQRLNCATSPFMNAYAPSILRNMSNSTLEVPQSVMALLSRHKIFDGMYNYIARMQSITYLEYLYWSPSSICTGPHIHSVDFLNQNTESLGHYLTRLVASASAKCESATHTCGHLKGEHTLLYLYSDVRIVVSIRQVPPRVSPPSSDILMWKKCKQCDISSQSEILPTIASFEYPFGRFLQLLAAPQCTGSYHLHGICQHSQQRQLAQWCFLIGNQEVAFDVEEIQLYTVSLPSLQVVYPFVHRLTKSTCSTTPFIEKSWDQKCLFFSDMHIETTPKTHEPPSSTNQEKASSSTASAIRKTRQEIMCFFQSAKQYLEAIESYSHTHEPAHSSLKGQIDLLMTNVSASEIELINLISKHEDDATCAAISNSSSNLNSIRRSFKKVSLGTCTAIERFKLKYFPGMKASPVWQRPDYCVSGVVVGGGGGGGGEVGMANCFVFPVSNVIVREEEPSSVLAFALSLSEVEKQSDKLLLTKMSGNEKLAAPSPTAPASPLMNITSAIASISEGLVDSASKASKVLMVSALVSSPSVSNKDLDAFQLETSVFSHKTPGDSDSRHIKIRFSEDKHIFTCKIFFAAEFRALRKSCGVDEAGFVESLSRCTRWSTSGGKTKAAFFKTQDDRFVVKQLALNWSVAERDQMLEFAPRYFEYFNDSSAADSSGSTLAKIFGFFSIKHKNAETGVSEQMDVLVMENIFCGFNVDCLYDLKGIPDRRKPDITAKEGDPAVPQVLWDGDWIEGNCGFLYFLEAPAKQALLDKLESDVAFLSDVNMMDYSFLVGINRAATEIRVGIIDFIGAYTMLKKMETTGKTAFRGNATVIPPVKYADRFLKGIKKHFVEVPNMWAKGDSLTNEYQ
ncbi:hypothetical protein BDR26DRAFT_823439 [Obelidium mucronatum]|nr:hypothetical protein BDR26DRAFT_823439 [Obelidium mucronatum]